MLDATLLSCNVNVQSLPCCKSDDTECNCLASLAEDYSSRADSYDCVKKMSTYVLRYGPAYMSEMYHYLVASNFKDAFEKETIRVASLGCGFAPDFHALKEYFETYKPEQKFIYQGVDSSTCWDTARPNDDNCSFNNLDLTIPFIFNNADVVIISKTFSTLYRNALHEPFLTNLQNAITTSLSEGSIIIYTDINHFAFGRDVFHAHVSQYLPNFRRFYFDGYSNQDWIKIENNNIICEIPDGMGVRSLTETGSTVFFEYRK